MLSTSALRPEAELLYLCARARMDEETSQRIRALLDEDLDWELLARTAVWHKLAPLLYWHLKQLAPERVPARVMDELQHYFNTNARRNVRLTEDLVHVLKLFTENDVPVICFKGPTLALNVYGNLALRNFTDLDILIHPEDFAKAKDLLQAAGYEPEIALKGAREELFVQSQHELLFRRASDESMVELHWKIDPKYFSFPLEAEELWTRTETVRLAGTDITVLKREELVLYLCAHGAKHMWERLEWICGVAGLLCQQEFDWEQLTTRARALKSERILYLGLLLAHELLSAPLPPDILQAAHACAPARSLTAWIRAEFFGPRFLEAEHTSPALAASARFYFRLNDRRRDGLRCGLRCALVPTVEDLARWSLPRVLFPFYLILRPMRLVTKYGWNQ